MDEKDYKTLAFKLLKANSAAEIKAITGSAEYDALFGTAQNWYPYGSRPKNWDIIGNQQNNAIGALTELITNAQDSVLTRKALESGIIDLRGKKAPQSMHEAVKRFFPHVVEGRLSTLEAKELTKLAEQSILVGVKRADKRQTTCPNYTIVDFGEGQDPSDFPHTFLSLSERNKEGIPFVQGKFNMGSTGCLRFCTRSDGALGRYKLIISKRYNGEFWGWTLIRIRSPRGTEALPVAEYFAPAGDIPKFKEEAIEPFPLPRYGRITQGSIIKLYEYDVGDGAHGIGLSLPRALNFSLMDCALPVRLYDFDAAENIERGGARAEGLDVRTFAGLSGELRNELHAGGGEDIDIPEQKPEKRITEFVRLVTQISGHAELGRVRVFATGVSEMQDWMREQPYRVLYTLNGQIQARERASLLNSVRVGLGDLRNHLIVNVVCDEMEKSALTEIFMADRERKVDNRLSRELSDLVATALKNDPKLKLYAQIIRRRRASEHVEDEIQSKDMLAELLRAEPALKELFGLGSFFKDVGKKPGVEVPPLKEFPTFLNPLNLRKENGIFVKDVPINTQRQIKCGTDAANDYLSRAKSPGWTICSLPDHEAPYTVSLYNGTATFTVEAPHTAKPGDTLEVDFGFQDNGPNAARPLQFRVKMLFTETEEVKKAPSGEKKGTKTDEVPQRGLPKFEWVTESQWPDYDFTAQSGALVVANEDQCHVCINQDNKYLRMIKAASKDEAERMLVEHRFKWAMGLLTLSIYKRVSADDTKIKEDDQEQVVRTASEAIAPYIVPLVKWLARDDLT